MSAKSNKQPIFSGVYAATLTPLKKDLTCDIKALVSHAQDLIRKGCSGVVLFGTTGEGASFSLKMRQKIIQECIQQGLPAEKIIIGVICSALEDAIQLTRTALENQCAGVLMAPPFYIKNLRDREIISYYRAAIQQVHDPRLKVILYHIPQNTSASLSFSLIQELYEEFPNTIAGIKDSEGNMALVNALLTQLPQLSVLMGRDQFIPEAVRNGASGAISGLANIAPELVLALVEQGKDSKSPNQLLKLDHILKSLGDVPFIPAVKSILSSEKGEIWSNLCPPLMPLAPEESEFLHFKLQGYL